MAFTVEDGTAKTDSNAYCDTAFVDAWFAETGGNATWTALTSDQKQQSIVKATRYIDSLFGTRFVSRRTNRSQSLQWPRVAYWDDGVRVFASNEVPEKLKRACAEYAVRASAASLISDPADSRQVEEKTEQVGPLRRTYKYGTANATNLPSSMADAASVKSYPEADMWLEELLSGNRTSFELGRA